MKKVTVILIGLFLMTFAFTSVNAQNAVSDGAEASARIITTLTINSDRDVDFGTFTAADGTVTLDDADVSSADYVGVVASGGSPTSGRFLITGSANENFKVSFPASVVLANTINAGSLTYTLDCSVDNGQTSSLDASGDATLYLGGQIVVMSTNEDGLYQNLADDLIITVQYE